MVTSFADGTKISFEQAIVANATGMTVAQRGMRGLDHAGHVDELTATYDVDELREPRRRRRLRRRQPARPGRLRAGHARRPEAAALPGAVQARPGPLYSFYTPYHLCHFEVPQTVARAVLFGDAAIAPVGAPTVEVVATAKQDLRAGTVLDGLGGYDTYGQAERADVTAVEDLLPMGLAEGAGCASTCPGTRSSATPMWSFRPAGWSTGCEPSRWPSGPCSRPSEPDVWHPQPARRVRMKVLMVTNAVAPDKLGGLERYVRELAATLVRKGHDVTTLSKRTGTRAAERTDR